MSRWMPPARVMLAAMVLWVAFPTVGWAQDLLDVVYGDDAGAKHLVRVDSEGPRVVSSQTLSDADAVWARGSATSDGRFVMSLASELQTQFPEPFSIFFLVIRDLLTGDTIRIDRGRSFANFALHPRRTEIVWSNGGGPAVLDAAGWRPLGVAYASAGSLSARCPGCHQCCRRSATSSSMSTPAWSRPISACLAALIRC
ncbi:MAG: hypothetical protein U0P30_00715 [Vicinamibacterales bacterium]